jgi:hypothetical protein
VHVLRVLRNRLALVLVATLMVAGCRADAAQPVPYGAATARVGESTEVFGWNVSVANLRFEADHVLIDVDAAPADAGAPHVEPQDIKFGLYGALLHPIESIGLGSCDDVLDAELTPLSTRESEGLSGTVCLGPIRDQTQVRGVYAYSPAERIPETAAAYAAAFPVGLPPTNANDTGLVVSTTSVEAWRANGVPVTPEDLGDPAAFVGNGSMLLGVQIDAAAAEYRDESSNRGGPMMVLTAPTLPPPGISPACSAYGSSVLVLPEASLNSVHMSVSLCIQGEINAALLYPTVSVVGTRAAVWTR